MRSESLVVGGHLSEPAVRRIALTILQNPPVELEQPADEHAYLTASVVESLDKLELRVVDALEDLNKSRRLVPQLSGPYPLVMADELHLIGIVVEDVGRPLNDGTEGSELYPVPVRLSRRATAREAEMLVRTWEQPPGFIPGISRRKARVSGDRFILEAQTSGSGLTPVV